jgi:phage shock protein A
MQRETEMENDIAELQAQLEALSEFVLVLRDEITALRNRLDDADKNDAQR